MLTRFIIIASLIVFILKIINVITLSWVLLLSPLWIPASIAITVLIALIVSDYYFLLTSKKFNDEN